RTGRRGEDAEARRKYGGCSESRAQKLAKDRLERAGSIQRFSRCCDRHRQGGDTMARCYGGRTSCLQRAHFFAFLTDAICAICSLMISPCFVLLTACLPVSILTIKRTTERFLDRSPLARFQRSLPLMPYPSFLRWLFASSAGPEASPEDASNIQEQINSTYMASSPTQEDWYWGRLATGTEEDFFWRRLSDNWYEKDVIPSTYLELHNQCYEQYNANPMLGYAEVFVSPQLNAQ